MTPAWPTPLDRVQGQRFSRSDEISDYLSALAEHSPLAQREIWGHSVQGRPLVALRIGHPDEGSRLRVMLTGSQHGASEAAGAEALLVIARELLFGDLRPRLDDLTLFILPNANPDGREADSSKNANGVNLNRDYVLLSQPESQGIDRALARIQPHVVLDAHESAALKRKTLGAEGYMTPFQAQIDFANNPGIPLAVQDYCEQQILAPLLARIAADGLPSQRYIREIASTRQPLTHGAVTAHIFRNKAGLQGALSFLLETRMDPRDGHYPSFRNIVVRRDQQLLCIRSFLHCIAEERQTILNRYDAQCRQAITSCHLHAEFIEHPTEPVSRLSLWHRATESPVEIEFANHRHLRMHTRLPCPLAYYITAAIPLFRHHLHQHSLQVDILENNPTLRLMAPTILRMQDDDPGEMELDWQETAVTLPAGTLRVPVNQPRAWLIPQLLEPQSTSSLFRLPAFRAHCRENSRPGLYRGYA